MEREEMDAEIEFIKGVKNIEYKAVESNTKKYLLLMIIAKHEDGKDKFYNPEGFVFVKLNQLIRPLDSLSDLGERAQQAINAKMQIIHLIENIKQQERYFKTKEMDYSWVYKRLEGIIDQTRIDLELENTALQNKLIASQIETNTISIRTNRNIAAFTFIAALYYGFELTKDYLSESDNNRSKYEKWVLIALFALGISGFLKRIQLKRRKNKTNKS